MLNRILYSFILLLIVLTLSISPVFAATTNDNGRDGTGIQDAANSVKNVVGGAENAVEDAVRDVSNTSKDVTGTFENSMNAHNSNMAGTNNVNTANDYSATRTATDVETAMGTNSTVWIWMILAIAAIIVIALVWYYSSQSNRHY